MVHKTPITRTLLTEDQKSKMASAIEEYRKIPPEELEKFVKRIPEKNKNQRRNPLSRAGRNRLT